MTAQLAVLAALACWLLWEGVARTGVFIGRAKELVSAALGVGQALLAGWALWRVIEAVT